MNNIFLYSSWRALPLPTRVLIAREFGISKTGSTHVSNNEVVSDGYKIEDVERALNNEAIQKFVGVDQSDTATLWELMVAKVLNPPVVTEVLPEIPANKPRDLPPAPKEVKKPGRKPKIK